MLDMKNPETIEFAKVVATMVVQMLADKSNKAENSEHMFKTADVCKRYKTTQQTLKKWRNNGLFPEPDIGGGKGADCLWRESTLNCFDRAGVGIGRG